MRCKPSTSSLTYTSRDNISGGSSIWLKGGGRDLPETRAKQGGGSKIRSGSKTMGWKEHGIKYCLYIFGSTPKSVFCKVILCINAEQKIHTFYCNCTNNGPSICYAPYYILEIKVARALYVPLDPPLSIRYINKPFCDITT